MTNHSSCCSARSNPHQSVAHLTDSSRLLYQNADQKCTTPVANLTFTRSYCRISTTTPILDQLTTCWTAAHNVISSVLVMRSSRLKPNTKQCGTTVSVLEKRYHVINSSQQLNIIPRNHQTSFAPAQSIVTVLQCRCMRAQPSRRLMPSADRSRVPMQSAFCKRFAYT